LHYMSWMQTLAHVRGAPPVAVILLPAEAREVLSRPALHPCLLCLLCLLCREVYDLLSPGFTGRCTAPLLVDRKARRAV
jgi:hypothetical protein